MPPSTLNNETDLYRLIVKNATEFAIYTLDIKGNISSWNIGSERIFYYHESEIIGKSNHIIFTPEDSENNIPEKEMHMAKDTGRASDVRWHVRKDGSLFWAAGSMMALHDDHNHHIGYVKIVQNRTHIKELEEELTYVNSNLEKTIKKRTDKLKVQSKQLRFLINELINAEQREKKELAQILHDDHQQILAALNMKIDRIARKSDPSLKQDILDAKELIFEAIEKNRTLTKEIWPPALIMDGVEPCMKWLSKHMFVNHGLDVHLNIHSNTEDIKDERVKSLLYQCIKELLFNVVKHANTKEAFLTMKRERNQLYCEVRDHGTGFTSSKKNKEKDLTFGIVSIHERIKALKGKMIITSEPKNGTIVSITIPITH